MTESAWTVLRVTALQDKPRVCSDGETERIVFDFLADAEGKAVMTSEVLGYEVCATGPDRKPHVSLVRIQPDMSTLDYEMVQDGKGHNWQLRHEGLIRLPPRLVPNAKIQWLSDGELEYQIVEVVNLLEEK